MRRGILRISPALLRRGSAATPSGPTYAAFQAHIATLATEGVAPNLGGNWISLSSGKYRATMLTYSGEMFGTSWNNFFGDFGTPIRAFQHAFPSAIVANDQVANGREVYCEIVRPANEINFTGITRNGYTSTTFTDGIANGALRMVDLIYWDGTAAQRMNPFAGTGPTPYVF